MKIINLENNNSNIFTGDVHGYFENFMHVICNIENFENCNIFVLGDIGVGFYKENYYVNLFNKMNKKLKNKNITLLFIRGNHDDPFYFETDKFNISNIIFVDDFDIVKTKDDNILCIGGAISSDRTIRWKFDKLTQQIVNDGYWENEKIKNIPENFGDFIKDININIICTHCAPNFIENNYTGIPSYYTDRDKTLIDDIINNQQILDNLYNNYFKNKILKWYYGHYHYNKFTEFDNVDFICIKDLVDHQISYRFDYGKENS